MSDPQMARNHHPRNPKPMHRASTCTPHPLLSYTWLHHVPIFYNIAFTPSARTVVDRTVHSPLQGLQAVTLAQPATELPIPVSSRLVLCLQKLPWVIAVGPIGSPPTFFICKDGEKRKAKSSAALTNLDVLYAVHTTLMTCVTPEEWYSLGEGLRAQRRVAEAYKERCTRMGGGQEGMPRVDWLGSNSLSLIHFCVLGFPILWDYIPILLVLHIYLLSTAYNDRTHPPGSLDHTYHPHLYYSTANVHVFTPDSLPHLFHTVFARFRPCSLYSLIVSYQPVPYMHNHDSAILASYYGT